MIARALVDIDADEAVGEALARFRWFIQATARYFAEEELELVEDLEQEAGIALWKADPTRFDAEDEIYLNGLLFKTIQKARRRERRKGGKAWRVEFVSRSTDHEEDG
jgi:hypothetical protein